MKVGILSTAPGSGKSYFMSVLGGLYSRSQGRNVCILTTGNANDNKMIIDTKGATEDLANPYVFKSILDAVIDKDRELFNYGARQGDENVFIYDLMSAKLDWDIKKEFFIDCIKKLPADLILVEITGDCPKDLKEAICRECDCFLLLTDLSPKGLSATKEYKETAAPYMLFRTGYVISRYDAKVMAEKKIKNITSLDMKTMMYFPYSPAVARLALNGILDQAAYDIIQGDPELISLRPRLLEIMQFLFDSKDRKVIKGVDKWSK